MLTSGRALSTRRRRCCRRRTIPIISMRRRGSSSSSGACSGQWGRPPACVSAWRHPTKSGQVL